MKRYLLPLIAVLAMLVSCTPRGRFYVKKSERPECNVVVERFDRDVREMSIERLSDKYGSFVELYAYGVLNMRSTAGIAVFLADSSVCRLYDDVESQYDDVSDIEKELSDAFSIYQYYFPDSIMPRIYMHVSGFNQCIVMTDSAVSFSADDYLGSDYPWYNGVMYNYELPLLVRGRVALDIVLGHLTATFPATDMVEQNLLDAMVEQGRLRYLLSVCFPDKSDADILGYTDEQFSWAKRYGGNVWTSLIENRSLFSSDWRLLTNYMQPAPFTTGLSADSPGQMGVYLGYNLVKAFAENNPSLSLSDIVYETSSQKILSMSGYNPR